MILSKSENIHDASQLKYLWWQYASNKKNIFCDGFKMKSLSVNNFTFLEKSQEVDFLGKKTGESFNIYRCEDCHTEKSEIIS